MRETPETIGDRLCVAHDEPDRPLEYGVVFCGCPDCVDVLMTAAECRPDLPIGLKFGLAERLVIDVGVLAASGFDGDAIADRYGEDDDWIREMWVARDGNDCMSPGEARLLEIIQEANLPAPEFNIEVDGRTGEWKPAGHRRVTRE